MRNIFKISLTVCILLFLVFSCDSAINKEYCNVTFISDGSAIKTETIKNGSTVAEPENPPTKNEKATFAGWYLNGEEYDFNTAVTGDIELKAYWKVANIYDIPNVTTETNGNTYITGIVDGNGYIVEEWQDLWTNSDLTIKGTIFEQGISIHTSNLSKDSTLTIEDCIIYTCDQEKIIAKLEENPNPNFRMDNSGDGLGIGIDTNLSQTEGFTGSTNIVIRNNTIIGANDPDEGFGSYRTQSDALNKKNKTDPRGRGISIGMASGNTEYLKSAIIEGNTISGIKCGGVQLFAIASGTAVNIRNNNFISWGINSDTLEGTKTYYAIRGNMADKPGTVELSGNTYAEQSGVSGDNRNLHDYRVGIDGWNTAENGGYDQSKAE